MGKSKLLTAWKAISLVSSAAYISQNLGIVNKYGVSEKWFLLNVAKITRPLMLWQNFHLTLIWVMKGGRGVMLPPLLVFT